MFSGIPVLALTATADISTQETICSQLCLKADHTKILISPNRKNIRLSVTKVKKELMVTQLDWLVEEVKQKGGKMPKTIIFCNTIRDIAIVINLLLLKLGEYAYNPVGSTSNNDFLIGIFHSVSWPHYKEKYLDEFKLLTSTKRIVIATSALSMGVNFPDIHYIINWGPARTLLDQVQEAGRAGRNGDQAHVIIIYHGNQLAHCEDEVKNVVKINGCYRVAMYQPFDPAIVPMTPAHDCCSNCKEGCTFDECADPDNRIKLPFERTEQCFSISSTSVLTRAVSNSDKEVLKAALTELSHGSANNAFGGVLEHCFSSELVDDIVKNCHYLFSIQDITERNLPVYSIMHCLKILEVIQEIFEDIPNFDSAMSFFAHSADVCKQYDSQYDKYFMDVFEQPDEEDKNEHDII